MARFTGRVAVAIGLLALAGSMADVYGRGGFGGGGGFRGGGGGMRPSPGGGGFRPSGGSAPSFSRPSGSYGGARPSGGYSQSRPNVSTRPSTGVRPSGGLQPGSRPNVGTPGSRPNVGTRPSTGLTPGNRPGIGQGNRPSQLPGTRPGIGDAGNRPGVGQGITNRPGISQLPAGGAALPGLGSRFEGTRAGVGDRMANRPQTLEGRRDDLQGRVSGGREDWQNHRQDMQGNRQDFRDQHREDWQGWADNHINNHGDWYHDSWHGDWYPGAGWSHMWDNYPVAAALGVTRWGVNRLAWGMGYWGYSNPYYSDGGSYGYDYSQPIYSYADTGMTEAAPATTAQPAATDSAAAPSADPGTQAFADARIAFYSSEYPKALSVLDTTLKTMPNDSVVHEFRGLVLFAMQKYPESAAAVYSVLSAGPGWDWTTLSSLYPSVDTCTQQLRALEQFAKQNPKSADAAFLLGYHYLTAGHAESANKQFKLVQALLPNDRLAAQLAEMTAPPAKDKPQVVEPTRTSAVPTVPPEKVVPQEKIVGNWQAISSGAVFKLELTPEGAFTWAYERGKDKQTVKGAFVVDQNNLVMEPSAGGTMLGEIEVVADGLFRFKMIGGDKDDQGLLFKKSS